ncbi:MAG: preprotein translocase subunit SecG [Nitrospira sp.]|nr:preprotein translocase subunit SecG [Nitrospira sp.]MDR4468655.1 preprotein translocase subunit SecG [Nitrospira sp.]
MLYTAIIVIHVFVCFLMIGAILLQSGKGAEIGASFGGSSQTVFGSRGPANFLSKLTVVVAAIFMVTSFSLAILAKQQNFSSTVIDMQPKSESTSESVPPPAADPAAKPSEETHPAAGETSGESH